MTTSSLPPAIFAPVFVLLGAAIICAAMAVLFFLRRRPSRPKDSLPTCSLRNKLAGPPASSPERKNAKRSPPLERTDSPDYFDKTPALKIPVPFPSKRSHARQKRFSRLARADRLQTPFNAELASALPRCSRPNTADSGRPRTADSGFHLVRPHSPATARPKTAESDTYFLRPWRLLSTTTVSGARSSASFFNRERSHGRPQPRASNPDDAEKGAVVDEMRWEPPTDWEVADAPLGMDGISPMTTIDLPMPAFLLPKEDDEEPQARPTKLEMKAPDFLDPNRAAQSRAIDPDDFPRPSEFGGRKQLSLSGAASTLSRAPTNASSYRGEVRSSVGADSVFCTCDVADLAEDREPGDASWMLSPTSPSARRGSLSSSVYVTPKRCRACMRHSRILSSSASGVGSSALGMSDSPVTPTRKSSTRKSGGSKPSRGTLPRRQHRRVDPGKVVVAGRLYQD